MTEATQNSTDSRKDHVLVIGIPYDENSTFMRGSAGAPDRIRQVLHSGSANLCAENGIDLSSTNRFEDMGNLKTTGGAKALEEITGAVRGFLETGARLLCLGGDHAVTYPVIEAYRYVYDQLTIVHFDAHPDLYESFEGNRYSHACPFARIMETRSTDRLIQIGIRTLNPHQREQAEKFGVEVHEMRNWKSRIDLALQGPVYISLDLDVFDPAFAPGISHHEPGGLSPREVFTLIHDIRAPVVGADIVEYNPLRDLNNVTAMLAAKCLKELAGKMLET